MSKAKCVSILGTGSDVGKSVTAAALCRIFSNMGIRVAPFKAQNMSNNSHVTKKGGEMGRAQVAQAQAARVEPHVDMNPVLLKPSSDTGSQVVVMGKPVGNTEAAEYFHDTSGLFERAKISLDNLRAENEFIVLEGAGSCAEVNLRDKDYVNFESAHAADAPVIIVADIDKGGVFAQIIGTMNILPEKDRKAVKGFIINKFRGDPNLFYDGIKYIEKQTGLPVLGLVPYYYHIDIDSEDGLPLDTVIDPKKPIDSNKINMAAIRLPHISNFTDFNPLQREPSVDFHYLAKPRPLDGYDMLFLPGTKNVRFDLDWLRDTGWETHITNFTKDGGQIGGICGGYQMLGKIVRDPHGVEGEPGETKGLGLLDLVTELKKEKILTRTKGRWIDSDDVVDGYEIHMGITKGPDTDRPVLLITNQNGADTKGVDGATSIDGKTWGTYLHGLFDEQGFRKSFCRSLRPCIETAPEPETGIDGFRQSQYDLLAEHFSSHLDMDRLIAICGLGNRT